MILFLLYLELHFFFSLASPYNPIISGKKLAEQVIEPATFCSQVLLATDLATGARMKTSLVVVCYGNIYKIDINPTIARRKNMPIFLY